MKNLIIAVVSVLVLFVAEAKTRRVNLDRLTEKKRTEYLISKAKEVVMRYGPGYYRDYAAPVIEREVFDTSKVGAPQSFLEENANRVQYIVKYPYDKSKERFFGEYSAEVGFWADSGEPYTVTFGNGWGFGLFQFTEEEIKSGKHVMPYDSIRHLLKYRDRWPGFKVIYRD